MMIDRVMPPQDPEEHSGHYELIDHTADIGIRVWGDTRCALFSHAGLALFDLITDRRQVCSTYTEQISVTGIDLTDLFVNWLRELLFFWTGDLRLAGSMDIISMTDTAMTGNVALALYDPDRHVIRNEIKAVTYHQVSVRRLSERWLAEVIFDV